MSSATVKATFGGVYGYKLSLHSVGQYTFTFTALSFHCLYLMCNSGFHGLAVSCVRLFICPGNCDCNVCQNFSNINITWLNPGSHIYIQFCLSRMGFPVFYGNLCFTAILVYMQNNICTWHKIEDSSKFEYTEYQSDIENCVITHHFQGKELEANIQQAVRQMDKYDLVLLQPISSQLYNLLANGWVTFGTILTNRCILSRLPKSHICEMLYIFVFLKEVTNVVFQRWWWAIFNMIFLICTKEYTEIFQLCYFYLLCNLHFCIYIKLLSLMQMENLISEKYLYL